MTLNTVLKSEFGLSNCKVKILNGYANKNYLVTAEEGRFIFKTYSDYRRLFEISDAENQLLLHLHAKKITDIPKPIAFNDGSFAKIIDLTANLVGF